jgi:cell division protein FtsB
VALNSRRAAARLAGLLLVAVAAYYALLGGEYSAFDLQRLSQRQQDEQARLERTLAEVDSLNELVTRLENDPATIEAVARERFGMIREGEILYRFVELPADSQAPDIP